MLIFVTHRNQGILNCLMKSILEYYPKQISYISRAILWVLQSQEHHYVFFIIMHFSYSQMRPLCMEIKGF